MAGSGDVAAVCAAPYLELYLVPKPGKRPLYPIPGGANCGGRPAFGDDGRVDGQRYCPLPLYVWFSAAPWRAGAGQGHPPALCLLGFWADELAPGAPLEYGAGDGAPEDGTQARWSLDMGAPPVGNGRRPLWGRLLLPQRYRILFVDADSFCILRFWPAFGSVFRRISGHNGPFCVYRLLPG